MVRKYSERQRKTKKEWNTRPENKEKKKEWESRPENKERRKEYNKEYTSRPEVKEYHKEYYLKNKEKIKEYHKKHQNNNPQIYFKAQIKHLKKCAIPFQLSVYVYKMALQSWGEVIKKRDKKCVICGSTDRLNAHHLIHKKTNPELSLNINNGVTLCELHHYEVHGKKI